MKNYLYNIKKSIVRAYRKYFTIDGEYTSLLPDRVYLKKIYKKKFSKELNLKNPTSLNEKLQWLKLYNRRPEYSIMADKYLSRDYIKRTLDNYFTEGVDYFFVPILGVWDNPNTIDYDSLPNEFVLKCNHDNGVIVCKDKNSFDQDMVNEFLNEHISRNYYKKYREWPYKNINRKIICEKLLVNDDGSDLVDYKIYCYGGKVRYFMYSLGEATGNHRNHKFDVNCNSIDYLFKENPAIPIESIVLPDNINLMLEIASVLCKNEPHIRIDMYNIDGRIYIGEMTFFSGGGYINILSTSYSDELSSFIDLNQVRRKKHGD